MNDQEHEDPRDRALANIYKASGVVNNYTADFYLLRSIAESLAAIVERLDSIDDALRNTVGGVPR